MPAVSLFSPIPVLGLTKGKAGNYRHTIIGFLTTKGVMAPPRRRQRRRRKKPILGFRFMQAQHVDIGVIQEFDNQINAQADRINIPGCSFHVGSNLTAGARSHPISGWVGWLALIIGWGEKFILIFMAKAHVLQGNGGRDIM